MSNHPNRESWLQAAITELSALFTEHEVPQVRVSMGWPHGGRSNTIGQCFPGLAAEDGIGHIFISPVLNDAVRILDVLLHELVHAVNHSLGQNGHGKEFAAIAKPLGLTGPMTATTADETLTEVLKLISLRLGPLPHGAILRAGGKSVTPGAPGLPKPGEPGGGTVRSGRVIKTICASGSTYKASISKTNLEAFGAPICPCHNETMEVTE